MKLPPRIERYVMGMQDVDFEVVYEPGKDEKDPLDYLSRHPLPETENCSIEKSICHIVEHSHSVILEDIQKETQKDEQLEKVISCMNSNRWELMQKDPDIKPFYTIRHEMYMIKDILMRMDKIIAPKSLQKKLINAAHSMGHLGMSKMKAMLRNKYWFPKMNEMIEQKISKCWECQITTKQHKTEPIKMTKIPEEIWELSIDFGGPYPDGQFSCN
jgi:hypothetical protein